MVQQKSSVILLGFCFAVLLFPVPMKKLSMSDYRQEDWLTNVPLYAINILADMLQESAD